MKNFYRVCVKLPSPEPVGIEDEASAFVPILHEWIRDNRLDLVSIDVADYAHVPDGPGIMLVTHEAHFGLDRSDGQFGLLAQRRTPIDGDAVTAIRETLRQAIRIAAMLEGDDRLAGRLKFDASNLRIEANDRLRVPNTDEGYEAFAPLVREAVESVYPGRAVTLERIANDPRDRLSIAVRIDAPADVQEYLAA